MTFNTAPLSIVQQLGIAILLVLALLGAGIAAGAYVLFDQFQTRLTEQGVKASTERLLTAIRNGPNSPFIDQTRLDPAWNRPLSGQYFLIRFGDQQWRSRSLWDTDLLLPEDSSNRVFHSIDGPGSQQLLVLTKGFERFGQHFDITVASDYSPLLHEFHRALWHFIVLWSVALLLALILLNSWMRRALRPLENTRHQLAAIQAGEEQLLDEQVPQELLPLIRQINQLLAQTRQSLQRSRNALDNLGHALKTPLAVLSSLIEREAIRSRPELHQPLRTQLDQINDRVHRELNLAQNAAGSGAFEPFIAGRDLPPLIDALEKAHRRHLALDHQYDGDLILPFDRADLIEVFGNLLDNAWKWADSKVAIAINESPTHWQLTVEDDGPGISNPSDREQALQRGYRLDESVAGQGLGLAIVADTVAAYGGKLQLDTSVLDGLAVRIELPKIASVGWSQNATTLPMDRMDRGPR